MKTLYETLGGTYREENGRLIPEMKHSINRFKKLQYFAKKLESIVAKRRCL